MHHKKHKVKIHKWNLNGKLEIIEHLFHDFESAMEFAKTQKTPVKIIDYNDEVVYQGTHQSTYA